MNVSINVYVDKGNIYIDNIHMLESYVNKVREFNRFHTRLVGALNERLLNSSYSLQQMRVLYEIANAPKGKAPSARDLGEYLQVDPGYMSRLISKLEKDGLVSRQPSTDNAKRLELTLTETGHVFFKEVDAASIQEVEQLMEPLTIDERQELVISMDKIRNLLGDGNQNRVIVLRDPNPGDLGLITSQQGKLYANEYGWDWTFEALVSEIVSDYVKNFDPDCEKCWIAEKDNEVVGSVFLVKQDNETAKLRLLYVDAKARGAGLGRKLVEECIRFAKAKGYKSINLWTNSVLVEARHIYETTGFELIEEKSHHSFGKDLVGQTWGRDL